MGILDGINGRIAAIGAILTGIVGVNSSLTSCNNETVSRYAGFRSAVASEETYWKERFGEYSDIVGIEKEKTQQRKLLVLAVLAQHQVPTFAEYRLGVFDDGGAIRSAQDRLKGMKDSLNQALAKDMAGDSAVASQVQQSQAFDAENRTTAAVAGAPEAVKVAAAPVVRVVSTRPVTRTQTLSNGRSDGWDIDMFWCMGAGDTTNYALALDRARRLADLATRRIPLAPGVRIGRIRLRSLPELRQGGPYPTPGSQNTVRAESDPAEQEAATALLSALNLSRPGFTLFPSDIKTKWYLSAFVCGAPVQPSGDVATAT